MKDTLDFSLLEFAHLSQVCVRLELAQVPKPSLVNCYSTLCHCEKNRYSLIHIHIHSLKHEKFQRQEDKYDPALVSNCFDFGCNDSNEILHDLLY